MRSTISILLVTICVHFAHGQLDTNYLNNFQYTIHWSNQAVVNGDTVVQLSCNLNIPDSSSISAIHIKVGNFKGNGSVVDYLFPIDPSYGLPNDYSLAVNGSSVTIILGNHTPQPYYMTVVLHDAYGGKSEQLYYNPSTNQLSMN